MDPLSIAASVAGLVALADFVIDRTYKTIISCKNAGRDAQRLLQETTALVGILKSLDTLSQHVPLTHLQHHLTSDLVKSCQTTLERLRGMLEKTSPVGQDGIKKLTRTLLWPISKTETERFLEELDRHKATFNLCLSVDLLNTVAESSHIEKQIGVGIADIQSSIANLYRIATDEKQDKLLAALGAFDAEGSHYTNLQLRQTGTGTWLLASADFEDWMHKRGSRLWCCGIPGAGKTVLAALAIQESIKSASPSHGVTYYYCDHKHPETQDLSRILACLAGQLARQHDECFRLLESDQDARRKARLHTQQLQADDISGLMVKMMRSFEDVTIIVDGLDECDDQSLVTSGLLAVVNKVTFARTLFFSRDEPAIRICLEGFERMTVAARESDLSLYVAAQLEERSKSGKLRVRNTSLKDEISERLVKGADGMFRWVACQLDHLCNVPTDNALRKALLSLPPNLNNTYERILERVNGQGAHVQTLLERALHWTFVKYWRYVHLPLLAEDLCKAVAIEESDTELDPEAVPDVSEILSISGSLLRLSSANGQLESAHFTVEEFLTTIDTEKQPHLARYKISEERSRAYCSSVAPIYCSLSDFAIGYAYSTEDMDARHTKDTLYFTLARLWPTEHGTSTAVPRLFQRAHSSNFAPWAQVCFLQLCNSLRSNRKEVECSLAVATTSTPLHFAAMFHMAGLIEPLVDHGYNVHDVSALGSVLQCALLGTDAADIAMRGPLGSLWERRSRGSCCETVRTLIRLGADIQRSVIIPHFAGPEQARSILWLAFLTRSTDVFESGGKIDLATMQHLQQDLAKEGFSSELLLSSHWPTTYFEPAALQLLTEHVVEGRAIEATQIRERLRREEKLTEQSEQAALKACIRSSEGIILDWLVSGFGIDSASFRFENGDTLLHVAAKYSRQGVVEWLLARGADPLATNASAKTPLHLWAETKCLQQPDFQYGEEGTLDALLRGGVDPTAQDIAGNTILHTFASLQPACIYYELGVKSDEPFQRRLREELQPAANVSDASGLRPWASLHGRLLEKLSSKDDANKTWHFCQECIEAMETLAAVTEKQLTLNEAKTLRLHELCALFNMPPEVREYSWKMTANEPSHLFKLFKCVLQFDVDVTARDAMGSSCIDVLVESLNSTGTSTLHALIDKWPSSKPIADESWAVPALCLAILDGNEYLGLKLLNAGVDPNVKCSGLEKLQASGYSATEILCMVGCPSELAAGVLTKLASPNNYLADGVGMIHLLATGTRKGKVDVLSAFLRIPGVDLDLPSVHDNTRGMTALMMAASEGDAESCAALASAGAKADEILDNGRSALDYACRCIPPNAQLVHALIGLGAAPTNIAQDGSTALLQTCARSDPYEQASVHIINLLLEAESIITTVELPAVTGYEYTHFNRSDLRRKPTTPCSLVFGSLTFSWGPLQLAAISGSTSVYNTLAAHLLQHPSRWQHLDQRTMLAPIWIACSVGNLRLVKRLLADGDSLELRDCHVGLTCVHAAVLGNQGEIVRFILDRQGDLASRDYLGRTPLALAEYLGHHSIAALLQTHFLEQRIRKPADSNLADPQRLISPARHSLSLDLLVKAIYDDDLELVKEMSSDNMMSHQTWSCGCCTPTMVALALGRTSIAACLEARTYRPDTKRICASHKPRGYNAMHLAAAYPSHINILHRLIDAVWTEEMAHYPVHPLHIAAAHGNLSAFYPLTAFQRRISIDQKLRPAQDWPQTYVDGTPCPALQQPGNTALHVAATAGQTMFVRYFLRNVPPDVNARNDLLQTPLHLAVHGQREGIAKDLVDCHADRDARDVSGATPLHIAAYHGNVALLRALKGSHAAVRDVNGGTPLTIACMRGNVAFTAALLRNGANFKQDLRGSSDIALLLRSPNPQALAFALSWRAALLEANDILWGWRDAQVYTLARVVRAMTDESVVACLAFRSSVTASTALYHAAAQGQLDITEVLLCLTRQSGVDVDAIGGPFGTALMAAYSYGHVEIVKELVRAGASPFFCSDESGNAKAVVRDAGLLRWLLVDRFVEQWKLCA